MKKFTASEKKFVPLFFFYDRFIDLEKYRFSRIRWSRRKCLLAFLLFFSPFFHSSLSLYLSLSFFPSLVYAYMLNRYLNAICIVRDVSEA